MDILGVDHVGIRVRDRDRALAFYQRLGFRLVQEYPGPRVAILTHPSGVELNLILNATADGPNVLMDVEDKRAGLTHLALRVPSADAAAQWLQSQGIEITEGPVDLGTQRSVFLRDPDRNVIELTAPGGPA